MSLYELEESLINATLRARTMPELADAAALREFARLYLLGALSSGCCNLRSIILDLPPETFAGAAPTLAGVADAILCHLGAGVPAATTADVLSLAAQ